MNSQGRYLDEMNMDLCTIVTLYVLKYFALHVDARWDVKEDHGNVKSTCRKGLFNQQHVIISLHICFICN